MFSKTNISINDCLVSGSDKVLFIAGPNLCKKLVNASTGPCITFINKVDFPLPHSQSNPRLLKPQYNIVQLCHHQIGFVFIIIKQFVFSNIFPLCYILLLYFVALYLHHDTIVIVVQLIEQLTPISSNLGG